MNIMRSDTIDFCGIGVLPVILLVAALLTAGCSNDPPGAGPHRPVAADNTDKTPAAPTPTPAPVPAADTLAEFIGQHKLAGRVALIEFGALGCGNSEKGLDEMARMHRDRLAPDLAYVRVEGTADGPAVDEYYAAKSLPFPVYRDAEAALATALDAKVIPTFLLMDKFQRVRYRGRFPGELKIIQWTEVLLAAKTDPGPKPPLFGTRKLDIAKLLTTTRLPGLKKPAQPLKKYIGRGGLVAIFTDTTCPFSDQAMADLPDVAPILATHGIKTVVINLDDAEPAVRKYYQKRRMPAPVLYDTTPATKNLWNVQSVPTVMYIDAGGKLRYNGKAIWAHVALVTEKSLTLKPGSLKFTPKGTGFG